jgi:tripartite ATP-independent transporter DctM subunit
MIDMSAGTALLAMLFVGLLLIFTGRSLAFALGWTALLVGFLGAGTSVFGIMYSRVWGILTDYIFIAGPMFIFMGALLHHAGITERLYEAMHVIMGRLRGGLAMGTIVMGVIIAVCVGVVAASIITIGMIALPAMLKRGYSKDLSTGAVCASGCLGILIPPSVMLVFYGPAASLSVGRLFMAAFMPGFLLATMYIVYIGIRCLIRPSDGPPAELAEPVPLSRKIYLLFTALLPPLFIMLLVLGTIFFGIASPTEAAALGAIGAAVLAATRGKLNFQTLKESSFSTGRVIAMAFYVVMGASMFAAVFIRLGCGDLLASYILATPGGKWGAFVVIMLLIFIMGMFIDWLGILFVLIPIVTPIGVTLGFDPIWFAMMICINLQASFLTPPFAYAIYYVKGLCPPEWGVETKHIIIGVIPFVALIIVCIGLCAVFPQIILWLPSIMVTR